MNAERLAKRFDTTMIGAIGAAEEVFGWTWGQGKPAGSLSESEREMDALRAEWREMVLDLGNRQKRAALAELAEEGL